ncbi:MAG: flippase-like domain-containing protein [Actinobacteria bacterium]|nr:flippase-like domain-containing protein [Actinomycetota bacterium]
MKRWRDLLRVALVAVAFALGAFAVARDLDGFVAAVRSIGFGRAFAGFALVVVGLLVSGEVWRACVAATAGRLSSPAGRRVFFVTQLGKYLPGAVWPVLAQIEAARRHGLIASRMAIGSLLFLALHLLTGLLVAAGLLPWASTDLLARYPWVFALVPVMALGLAPPVLGRAVTFGLRLLRRPPLPTPLTLGDIALPSGLLLVTWSFYGAGAAVVAAPLQTDGGSWPLFAAVTGGFALAWAVGVLFLPAPAGVGAREVVLVLALAPMVGTTSATSIAIVLRVIHTAGDLALALVSRLGRPAPEPQPANESG